MNLLHSFRPTAPTLTPSAPLKGRNNKKLRVATFNYLPSAYKFATEWIHENGHEHVLAVTSPGIKTRATPGYKDVLPLIPSDVNTIVTSKVKSVLTPILHQFKPDIVLCFTFAHRLDSEICKIPTYGIVNIHPSILPLYRGPNPLRQFYDGATEFGVTAHRLADEYDTGAMLSQESAQMPELVTRSTSVKWGHLIKKCIANGMEKAIAGEAGVVQDDAQATYGGAFTEDEKWVDLTEATPVILRKTLGLNLAGGLAKAMIDGQIYKIHSAQALPSAKGKPAGSVIKQEYHTHEIATADGAVKLVTELYNPHKKYSNVLPCAAFFNEPSDLVGL
ncbi:MAG: hypothetical protein JNN12_08975 [Bacteroidetes Order II. Incertae sedis bacterium]|nr:hypothetical protein [Bacteroidetes Order II. bacterium]